MPCSRVFFGLLEAFTLHSAQMKDARAVHILDFVQDLDNLSNVMAVKRTEIPYVKTFENVLSRRNQSFQGIVESKHHTPSLLFDDSLTLAETVYLVAPAVVSR